MFRQIYSFDGANEASNTMSGKLYHTLAVRPLKNLARTVEEECFYTAYIAVTSRDG